MHSFFKTSWLAIMLILLAGCSNEGLQTELEQLKEENAQLNEQLSSIEEDLATAYAKLETLEEESRVEDKPEPAQSTIVPTQIDSFQSLMGEWFYTEFRENWIDSWTQSLVFYEDGTGSIIRTFYLPKDIEDYSTSDSSGTVTMDFSWSLSGDTLHTAFDEGEHFIDYTFLSEEQQLLVINEGGEVRDGTSRYVRKKPSIPDDFVEKSVFLGDIQNQTEAQRRLLLGTWYFDVLTWTFRSDGSGVIDIPKLGEQPATQQEFSYSVTINGPTIMVTFDWADGRISYFFPTFHPDGSMTLETSGGAEPITMTRTFDPSNCPISEEIIANGIGVWTGSIFSEILPQS